MMNQFHSFSKAAFFASFAKITAKTGCFTSLLFFFWNAPLIYLTLVLFRPKSIAQHRSLRDTVSLIKQFQ